MSLHSGGGDFHTYSYIGNDHPISLPISLDNVAMPLYESVQLNMNSTDLVAAKAWDHLAVIPRSDFIGLRLGPTHQMLDITIYHQLHCLSLIYRALLDFNDPEWLLIANDHHVLHCFGYLRQGMLCQASDTLEKGDFMEKDFERERVGETLICKDWEQLSKEINYQNSLWESWKQHWN